MIIIFEFPSKLREKIYLLLDIMHIKKERDLAQPKTNYYL